MYITSRRSEEKIEHKAGRCACIYCAPVMKRVPQELEDIKNICEANNISIVFNPADGTLEITTPVSEWKLATIEKCDRLFLYHKNTRDVENSASPYAGYHSQNQWHRSVMQHLKYIVEHDWFWMQKRISKEKKQKAEREVRHYSELRTSRRKSHIVRMRREELRYGLRELKCAAGM